MPTIGGAIMAAGMPTAIPAIMEVIIIHDQTIATGAVIARIMADMAVATGVVVTGVRVMAAVMGTKTTVAVMETTVVAIMVMADINYFV
jgi:hypothetical protein